MGDLSSATNPAGKKPICREEEEEREREVNAPSFS